MSTIKSNAPLRPATHPAAREPASSAAFIWGRRPLALLPAGLRTLWAEETLPDWVVAELGLPGDATFEDLGSGVWRTAKHDRISGPLRTFLTNRISYRWRQLRHVRLLETMWPRQLDPRGFPWSARIRDGLSRANLLDQPVRLARLTAPDLRLLRSMGVVSILEFATVAETVLSGSERSFPAPGRARARPVSSKDDAWAYDIHAHDPRFTPLLAIHAGTLGDHRDQLRAELVHLRAALRQFRSARSILRARYEQIRRMSLDAALADLVQAVSGLSDTHAAGLLGRLGLDGTAPLSLSAAGARAEVSRERMRQIEERVLRLLPKEAVFLPQLDEALHLLDQLAPCLVARASRALRARGLCQGDRSVAMVLTAAALFARHATVELASSGKRLVRLSVSPTTP